jgi:hypothetical protein
MKSLIAAFALTSFAVTAAAAGTEIVNAAKPAPLVVVRTEKVAANILLRLPSQQRYALMMLGVAF